MTKWFKWAVVIIVFAAITYYADQITGETGYILISFGNWTVDGSIVGFIALLLMAILVTWLAVFLVKLVFRALVYPSAWWQNRQSVNQANFLQNGIDYMALGQWQQAKQEFKKVKRKERLEMAKRLTFVCDAQLASADSEIIELEQIESNSSQSLFAQLTILVKQHRYQEALKKVKALPKALQKYPLSLQQLALLIYARNHDWNQVSKWLPKINKQVEKAGDIDSQNDWNSKLTFELSKSFDEFIAVNSVNQMQAVWQSWPKNIKKIPALFNAYSGILAKHKQSHLVEQLLLEDNALKNETHILSVVRTLFDSAGIVQMDKLFAKVQHKASAQPENKVLLTIYGYLAAGHKDYQLAKQALEQSLYSQDNKTDKRLYAYVLSELGELRRSIETFKSL